MCIGYRDRRVERQRRWTEELFRRLATVGNEAIVDIRDAKWFIFI